MRPVIWRDGAEVARRPHKPKVVGSNPTLRKITVYTPPRGVIG